jgi:hypothetical protein
MKVFEDCFIKSLAEHIKDQEINFHQVFEAAWRKFIQYIFKRYTDGMEIEREEESKINNK